MTTEEAIKYLIKPVATSTEIGEEKQKEFEAYNMAIEALRNEINCVKCVYYTERETYTGIKGVCKMDTAHREDLIRREDAIDLWWHDEVFFGGQRDDMTKEQWLDYITDVIGSLPSVEPKIKCIAQIRIDRDDMENLVNKKVNEIVGKMSEPKTGKWIKTKYGYTWKENNVCLNFVDYYDAKEDGE